MVQILKDDINNLIVEKAEEEFLKNGFEKASMRKIASAAGITVGNIYKYFRNKSELFESILRPVYSSFSEIIKHHDDEVYDGAKKNLDQIFAEQVHIFLDLVKDSRTEFLILIYGSRGSRFEKVVEDLNSELAQSIKDHLDVYYGKKKELSDHSKYAGSLARCYLEGLFSIIKNYDDKNLIRKYADEFLKIIFYGFVTVVNKEEINE